MKCKKFRSRARSTEDIGPLFPHKVENTALNALSTCCSSLHYFEVNLSKEWLIKIYKASHPCLDGISNTYDAFSPFERATMMPLRHQSYLFLKKESAAPFLDGFTVWFCGEVP